MRQLGSKWQGFYHRIVSRLAVFDGIAPLLMRIFLAPVFIKAGYGKLRLDEEGLGLLDRISANPDVVAWFGNPDWGLGLPMPELLACFAGWAEFFGGWLLLLGLLTRIAALPLMFTMIIAAATVHWDNGWHTLPEARLTVPWEWRTDLIDEGLERKAQAVSILRQHGNYPHLTSAGSFTVLKNGIEFAATYFVMLLSLFFTGGGRFFSMDYWAQRYCQSCT